MSSVFSRVKNIFTVQSRYGQSSVPYCKKVYLAVITLIFVFLAGYEIYGVYRSVSSAVIAFERIKIYSLLYLWGMLHYFFYVKTLYKSVFRYRYIFGALLFIFLVAGKYSYSSVGMFDSYIQPGSGSALIAPVFNAPQSIRSDEWLVSTPFGLSGQFLAPPYSEPNYIMRAADTPQLAITGILFSFSILGRLFSLGYLFGAEYGVSFSNWFMVFTMFFGALEFFYVITKKNKFISAAGALAVTFSPFHVWYSFNTRTIAMALIAIVCVYYFVVTRDNFRKKVLYALGVTVSTANFIVLFYPPWQVPVAYFALGMLLWIVIENIRLVKLFRSQDFLIIAGCLIFLAGIVLYYLSETKAFNEAVMNTVYPGKRVGTGGGGFNGIMTNYWRQILYPAAGHPDFYSLFPVPLIGCALLIYKTRDRLAIILGLISIIMLSYNIFGWPEALAKATLFSYTTAYGIAPVISFVQVVLFFYLLSNSGHMLQIRPLPGLCVGAVCAFSGIYLLTRNGPGNFTFISIFSLGSLIVFAGYCLVCSTSKKIIYSFCSVYVIFCLLSAITVNPLIKGLDVIYSKPSAQKIQEIVRETPKSRWVTTSHVYAGFLIANGAPTINSVNYIPNMDLWELFDPAGENEYVYNRFAHISITLIEAGSEPAYGLIQADHVYLHITVDDLVKMGVSYLFSAAPVSGSENTLLDAVYAEDGIYIYEVKKFNELF